MGEIEYTATQFSHPDITTGMHTNGPPRVWIRVDGTWYPTGSYHMHRVRAEVEQNGPGRIMRDEWDPRAVWRSMTEAPRDGTEVLLQVESRAGMPGKCLVGHWMPGGHCIDDHPPIDAGWYFWNGCMFERASKPVAWAPLPKERAQEKNNVAGEESDE